MKKILGEPVDIEHEIPFHDVDSLQIVWHGHYLKYIELGRTALMRARGLDVTQLVTAEHYLVVIDSRCRYSFPLRYADRVRVRSWFEEVEHRIVIGFELTNLTHGRRSARGQTVLATVTKAGKLLLETPHALRQFLP